jgi:hypothetical protein
MTAPLGAQRCHNHRSREAAARCPQCGRFFCRECVTEHEDRVLCSGCLTRAARAGRGLGAPLMWLAAAGQYALGTLILWAAFYQLGCWLLSLPSDFHEGSLWRK